MEKTTRTEFTHGTDCGPACDECGEHLWAYRAATYSDGADYEAIIAACVTCGRELDRFRFDGEMTVRAIREAHEAFRSEAA